MDNSKKPQEILRFLHPFIHHSVSEGNWAHPLVADLEAELNRLDDTPEAKQWEPRGGGFYLNHKCSKCRHYKSELRYRTKEPTGVMYCDASGWYEPEAGYGHFPIHRCTHHPELKDLFSPINSGEVEL